MSRRSRAWLIVLTGLLVGFAVLGWVVEAWTEWLWFTELGATQVFSGQLWTRIGLFAVAFVLVGGFIFANLWLAYRMRPFLPPTGLRQEALERYRYLLGPRLGRWFAIVSGVIAFFAGLAAQGHWQQWMLFRNAEPFNVPDPVFGIDIGFYIFRLPFWQYLLGTGFTVTVLGLLGALAVHYLYGGLRLSGPGDRITTAARAHLTGLVALFVILKAVAYVVDQRALLLDTIAGTKLTGAGYTAINALLPAKEMLTYISVIVAIAILVFSNAVMRNLVWPGLALGLLGISAVAIGGIYPWGVQTLQVEPSRNVVEAEFIKRAIDSTRTAFGLEATKKTDYRSGVVVPPASLAQDQTIVPNIRLLDPAVVSEAYTQLSQVRSFYHFGDKLDIDRYQVGGKTQDYVVGLRELSYSALTGTQDNWINRHTIYTHGYGLVAAPANEICGAGQPKFVSGFFAGATSTSGGCTSAQDEIPVQQPRVYYGEQMSEYAIVGKPSPTSPDAEYDRPVGETTDAHHTYEGKGGVPIGSLWRQLLYSVKFAESNFLLADAVNDNSKLLYERDPRTRVQKVAPFLTLDGDPYPAAVGGRIVWIIDGYTTSANFPYSKRVDLREVTNDSLTGDGTFQLDRQQINYIRNSVKATVDAYDGTVTLYEFDQKDPLLKAWNNAFGGKLVKPKSEVPAELAAHFRYPADLFKVQRDLLTQFHVTEANDFYTEADFWAVPDDPAKAVKAKQPPYYLLTELPGQGDPRFQIVAAVTPRDRQNLAALISGSYVDGEPRLELLELGKDSPISGPIQAQQKMENFPDARSQLNIWGTNGVKGNLLSLPYEGGMLYVEPIYLKSSGERAYPQLQRVLMNFGEKVAFAETVQAGIAQLVGGATPAPPPPPTDQPPPTTGGDNAAALAAAAAKVNKAIEDLRAAQQKGDFAAIGKAMADLDAAIKEFQAAQAAATNPAASPSPSPSPSPSG
ncbi:UPF0182 family protein [Allorhizocola rhizosphaerae]|uniref:UPF0182 family membrane protein n=1 Tax=Allorhizocola rhizosphaerae TaxID=1872709 RepID=UPI000E3D7B5D|nr:UPF0182 family protein [Allorhizocola rhizosphaerae]